MAKKKLLYETLSVRQEEMRMRLAKPLIVPLKTVKKRNRYKWGAKSYLAEFKVGETRVYDEQFLWATLKSLASKMKSQYGVQYVLNTIDDRRYITRIL